jgi:poly(A) polymerase/tRNA nucleotidyltransferase (CCA-adding enzyme)
MKPLQFKFNPSCFPDEVKRLCGLFRHGEIYAVGGMIRDSILAQPPDSDGMIHRTSGSDWDFATSFHPKEVMKILRNAGITAIPVGIEHGTVAAVIDKQTYEITTYRHDVESTDGRHAVVRFAESLQEDLERRDFTINAFALDINTGEITDLFDGIKDLQERRIQTVGDPNIRFTEDHLRMIRACRFAAKLEGTIEPDTFRAIQRNAHLIQRISAERLRDELMKMLTYPKPSHGFVLMQQSGLLMYVLPELEAGFGVGQNRFHADDVAMHTLHTVDALSPKYPKYRWMAILHDLGKVPCKAYREQKGDYVFYGHQYASKKMGRTIMKRLRFSNKDSDAAKSVVENHMYNLKPGLSEGAIRRFVCKLGKENIDGFLRMRMADRRGNRLNDETYERGIFHFLRTLRKIEKADDALTVRDLQINGNDLIAMKLPPGPLFSRLLDHLLEQVLDDPSLNNRDWLLEQAQKLAEEYHQTGAINLPDKAQQKDGESDD